MCLLFTEHVSISHHLVRRQVPSPHRFQDQEEEILREAAAWPRQVLCRQKRSKPRSNLQSRLPVKGHHLCAGRAVLFVDLATQSEKCGLASGAKVGDFDPVAMTLRKPINHPESSHDAFMGVF